MISSIVKHSYISGPGGVGRAKGHVSYISNRPGPDRDDDRGRTFFTGDRDDVPKSEVHENVERNASNRGVVVHKFTISPGVGTVDTKAYARGMMRDLGRSMGQNISWFGVSHRNTAHQHVHIVVLGKDKDGRQVHISKREHTAMRTSGDGYLDNKHRVERFGDREIPNMIHSKTFSRDGDRVFSSAGLFLSNDPEERKKREARGDSERQRIDWGSFRDDMGRALATAREGGDVFEKGWSRRNFETSGRWSDSHGRYTDAQQQERWYSEAARNPDAADHFEQKIQHSKDTAVDRRSYTGVDTDIGKMLWGDGRERQDNSLSPGDKEFRDHMNSFISTEDTKVPFTSETPLSTTDTTANLGTPTEGKDNSGQGPDDGHITFENDREAISQTDTHPTGKEDERGRDDGSKIFENGGF